MGPRTYLRRRGSARYLPQVSLARNLPALGYIFPDKAVALPPEQPFGMSRQNETSGPAPNKNPRAPGDETQRREPGRGRSRDRAFFSRVFLPRR